MSKPPSLQHCVENAIRFFPCRHCHFRDLHVRLVRSLTKEKWVREQCSACRRESVHILKREPQEGGTNGQERSDS